MPKPIDRSALRWKGNSLFRGGRKVCSIVRDDECAFLWRLVMPNGELSDRANLTRAKDAAMSLAALSEGAETARKGTGCDLSPEATHA